MNKDRLLKKFTPEELADLVIEKDEEIERLRAERDNIKYIGRLYIEGKWYSFYIDKEGTKL